MNAPAWWAAVGVVVAAFITAGVNLRVAARSVSRRARMEAVKADLEVAALLSTDDEERRWLEDYARLRIRAIALDETRPSTTRSEKTELGYWGGGVVLGALALTAGIADKGELGTTGRILTVLGGTYLVVFGSWLSLRAITRLGHRLPGLDLVKVSASTQEAVAEDLQTLHRGLRGTTERTYTLGRERGLRRRPRREPTILRPEVSEAWSKRRERWAAGVRGRAASIRARVWRDARNEADELPDADGPEGGA